METYSGQKNKETSVSPSNNIILTYPDDHIQLDFPKKGFHGKALVSLSVIGLWLITMLVWSILLLAMKPVNVLYSIPFWAIGIFTLVKAVKILSLDQTLVITTDSIVLSMRRGLQVDKKVFEKSAISISMVEGQYYTFSGLNKRGQFPAIIFKNEAFGFAERYKDDEKRWIVNFINQNL